MKNSFKEIMQIKDLISAEQIKEESNCTFEQYCMALYYAELYIEMYNDYVKSIQEADKALEYLADQLGAFGYNKIGKSDRDNSFLFESYISTYTGWEVQIDYLEEVFTPIDMFNIVHSYPLSPKEEEVELPF